VRAAVTTESGTFETVELPDPSPGPDQLVVRVAACGVCGSDIKARPFMPAGTVMGHELGGEVVAVGTEAAERGWREGSIAAVLPVISCGSCPWCVSGDVAHCSAVRFIGMGSDAGGFAEFAVVPARHAFPVPESVSSLYSALVEPFAVGLHAINAAEVDSGDDVLIIGAGGVGLTTLSWAAVRGARRVTAVDPDDARREAATAAGANDVLAAIEEAPRDTYDAVIECVGRPELVELAAASVRARGRLIVAGACDQPFSVEPISGLLKELTIRFSVCYRPSEFRRVIEAFASGEIDPSFVEGPVLSLDQLGEAFSLVQTGGSQGRVLVAPQVAA
jgi:(R,R)-butanediol dehydrogenase / meso-butanediol dehydrogenase / diacetyl reductase